MAKDDDTSVFDIAKAAKNLYDIGTKGASLLGVGSMAGNGISTASASSGIGAGQLGGVGSSSIMSAIPFLGLAAFNLYNMFADEEHPAVMFSGSDPQYLWNGTTPIGTHYKEYTGDGALGTKSDKYDYYIYVKDTDDDAGYTQAMIEQYDQVFDDLEASGVPVNDLIANNSDFIFGGGVGDGVSPDVLFENVMEHFAPDIEAYQSGSEPTERTVTIYPQGNPADPNGMAGRDAWDMGLTEDPYQVTVGGSSSSDAEQDDSENVTYLPNEVSSDDPMITAEDTIEASGSTDTTATTSEPIEMDGRSDLFFTEFANQWFGDESNAKLLIQDHADHLKEAAETNTEAVNTAVSDQSSTIDDLVSQYANPISFSLGGNDISFVPGGSLGTIKALSDEGQTDMTNTMAAAANELQNASATSPSVAGLAYLDELMDALGLETRRNQEVTDAEYKAKQAEIAQQNADTAQQNAGANQQRVDQGEPGWSDYIGEGIDILGGIDTAWGWVKKFF